MSKGSACERCGIRHGLLVPMVLRAEGRAVSLHRSCAEVWLRLGVGLRHESGEAHELEVHGVAGGTEPVAPVPAVLLEDGREGRERG